MPVQRPRTGSTGVLLTVCCVLAATAVVGASGRRSFLRRLRFTHIPVEPLLDNAARYRIPDKYNPLNAQAQPADVRRQPPRGRTVPQKTSLANTRDQTIAIATGQLSSDGLLAGRFGVLSPSTGQFIPTNELQVSFFRDGRPVASLRPGSDGLIQIKLKPAIYSIVATGLGGTVVQRLRVVDAGLDAVGQPDPFEMTVVPRQDFAMLKLVLQRRGVTSEPSGHRRKDASDLTPSRSNAPLIPVAFETPAKHHYVQLHDGGLLTGRVGWLDSESQSLYALERVELYIIKNGHMEAQVYTDRQGYFSVGNLRPGRHSIIGFGGNVPGTDPRSVEGGLITLSVYLTSDHDLEVVDESPNGGAAINVFLVKHVQAARGISSVSVNMHGARIVKTTATREASGGWTGMIGRAKSRSKPGPVATSRVTRGGRGTVGIAGVLTPFAEVDQTTDQNPASTGFSK